MLAVVKVPKSAVSAASVYTSTVYVAAVPPAPTIEVHVRLAEAAVTSNAPTAVVAPAQVVASAVPATLYLGPKQLLHQHLAYL